MQGQGDLWCPATTLNLVDRHVHACIIKGITPDVSLSEILKGSIPFMIMMVICIIILCIFPEIVTWLPDKLMGKALAY